MTARCERTVYGPAVVGEFRRSPKMCPCPGTSLRAIRRNMPTGSPKRRQSRGPMRWTNARLGVGKRIEPGENFALRGERGRSMPAFSDVDAAHGPAVGKHRLSRFRRFPLISVSVVFHDGDPFGLEECGAATARRSPYVEGVIKQTNLIQNLVGDAGRPARNRSQPTHSWRSGVTRLTKRATLLSSKRTLRRVTWRPASRHNVSRI